MWVFLGLSLLAFLVIAPILGVLAWSRSRDHERRIRELEQELWRLRPGGQVVPVDESPRAAAPLAPSRPPPEVVRAPAQVREDVALAPTIASAPRPAPPVSPPPIAPPPVSPSPVSPTVPERPAIEWERWIGLRGAAVAGGAVLALATLLFLRYAVEAGFFPPIVRVSLAVLAGLGAVVGSEVLRRRGYEPASNAVAGAGVVALFGAVWAARALYGLIPAAPAFAGMVLITAFCGLLSWQRRSLVVAVLGLAGGFAAPALLTSVERSPIGLFGYLLLLDAGLLVLAWKRRWPVLAVLGLAGTGLYQAFWVVRHEPSQTELLGLAVLAAFALLFTQLPSWLGRREEETREPSGLWRRVEGAAALLPFAFALHLAGRAELGVDPLPLAALLALLALTAGWLAGRFGDRWLGLGAAAGSFAVMLAWLGRNGWGQGQEWRLVAAALLLAGITHAACELRRRRPRFSSEPGRVAAVLATGLLGLLVLAASLRADHFWPIFTGWAVLAALLVRQGFEPGRGILRVLGAAGVGLGSALFLARVVDLREVAPVGTVLLVALASALVFQALAGFRRANDDGWAESAAIAVPVPVLIALVLQGSRASSDVWLALGVPLLFAWLIVLAATRLRGGGAFTLGVLLLAAVHWTRTLAGPGFSSGEVPLALGLEVLAVVLATIWPVVVPRALGDNAWARATAALAGVFWFLPLRRLYLAAFGDGSIGVLPVGLGLLALATTVAVRRRMVAQAVRTSALAWFAGVALAMFALAVPLQLDKEWITVAWALQGLALIALWRRLDHPGLKYFAAALFAAVTLRLVTNPAVLTYHPASGIPFLNWISYTYLIPAGCLLLAAKWLWPLEAARSRPAERALYERGRPIFAAWSSLAAILVVFVWLNLSILNLFAEGGELRLTLERAAARDLSLSLAWAVYALLLLTVAIRRDIAVLRWISLAFLVLTIAKVFLYDLGELEDLYRVASLVALAVSLLVVSLIYQRFVFRRAPSEPAAQREEAEP